MKKIMFAVYLCAVAVSQSSVAVADAPKHSAEEMKNAEEMVAVLGIRVKKDAAGRIVLLDTAANRSWVNGAQMQEILVFPKLASLTLEGPSISDALVPRIVELEGLVSLALRNTLIGDKGVEQFTGLKRLKIIELRAAPLISDAAMKTLATMPSLRAVRLVGGNITDTGIDALLALPRLSELDVRGCNGVTKKGIARLVAKKSLRTLKVGGSEIGDEALELIADMVNLRGLDLEGSSATDAGVARLGKLPLVGLTLYQCPNVTDEGLKVLANYKNLQRLTLRDVPVRGEVLALLPHPERLISLNMAQSRISDVEVSRLAKLKNLEQLNLSETAITDAAVDTLSKLSKLKKCMLTQTGISEDAIGRLRTALPHCNIRSN